MRLLIFTDGSVATSSGIGVGAYLAVREGCEFDKSLAEKIRTKRFEDTSSTRLELQTLLWALSENRGSSIVVYTDSRNILGLESRRNKLEDNNFFSKKGKRLTNYELYREFFRISDAMDIQIEWVSGHSPSRCKTDLDKVFSLVDRASRRALRENSGSQSDQMDGH